MPVIKKRARTRLPSARGQFPATPGFVPMRREHSGVELDVSTQIEPVGDML
jgi:hypothetical protein